MNTIRLARREFNRKMSTVNAANGDDIVPLKSLKDGSWVKGKIFDR